MNPNAVQLATRDRAFAAMIGALPGRGADFGFDRGPMRAAPPPHSRPAARFAAPPAHRPVARFGYEYDRPGFGAEAPAAPHEAHGGAHPVAHAHAHLRHGLHPHHPMHPDNWQHTMGIVQRHHHMTAYTEHREMVLEPNKGSNVKIERYSFPLAQALTLGAAGAQVFNTLFGTPSVYIRSQRITANAPTPGFAYFQNIQTGNVGALVGAVGEDAFSYSALAYDSHLDLPTLAPGIPVSIQGNYTGFVPPGFVGGAPFLFTVSFKGPASMTA
jgi:hypothetical protein